MQAPAGRDVRDAEGAAESAASRSREMGLAYMVLDCPPPFPLPARSLLHTHTPQLLATLEADGSWPDVQYNDTTRRFGVQCDRAG
jgi:hypothetical protein